MMTSKQNEIPDLNTLAIEACDMWQEHLAALASDPAARADLTRMLEPQRRMFAEWVGMMQKGGNPEFPPPKPDTANSAAAKPEPETDPAAANAAPHAAPAPPSPAAPRGVAGGDDPLRTAQLALRVAELEKRLARLEDALAKSGAPRRTQRTTS
jgi:hypothetical protein